MNSRLPDCGLQHPVSMPPNTAANKTNAITFFMRYNVNRIACRASVAHI